MEQTTTTTVPDTPEVKTREHPPLPASEKDLRWKQASRNPRFRLALIVGGIVLMVAGFFLWRYLGSYESTDDAQIDGHLNAISTRVSGHVIKLLVNDNQFVEAGTPLVEIDPKDYQVAVAKARAAYQDAQATADSLEVNVPITSVNTGSQLSSSQAEVESGRANDKGVIRPWPWTINAEGRGQFFATKLEAIAAVRALQASGVRSIDVGCMQVNLMYHPNAFASLDEAFDAPANAPLLPPVVDDHAEHQQDAGDDEAELKRTYAHGAGSLARDAGRGRVRPGKL